MAWYYWIMIVVGGLLAIWGALALGLWLYVERDTRKEINTITPEEVYPSQRKEFERWP